MTTLGLILLIIGALVAVVEAHYPTHGVAGGLGVAVMAVGAVLAISGLGAGVVIGLIGGLALAGAGGAGVALTVTRGAAARRRRVRGGAEGLIGQIGVVRSWAEPTGSVSLQGAVWQARRSPSADEDDVPELTSGDKVVVERLSGLTLSVRPAEDWELI
ncbi:MAG TPA: NfeD family protein [Solirubrobacteraceae bacterium]|nr:NfeD family protein [Solirubrobacteraceae bacterium]